MFSCSKIEQKQLNTWVSFQSAEQPLLGQFSVSGNKLQKVVAAGQHPIVLLAHEVTYDSQPSQPCQAPLVTGYGEDLYGCFFEAGPKMYVLAGRGARRYAAKPALVALEQMTTEAYAYG